MDSQQTMETYLLSTFSRFQDQYGQKLDISLALPTLVNIVNNTNTYAGKKYDFVGEAACQFSIRCILAKQFNSYDNSILDALAKKFRALFQVNKLVRKEIQLKQHVQRAKLPLNIIQAISGVLFEYYGAQAVEKFIENAVIQIANQELGEATAIRTQLNDQDNPLQQLNILVTGLGGMTKAQAIEAHDKQWQVKVICKLKPTSMFFSHERTATSKYKAKTAAYKDILTFLQTHADVYQQLQQEGIDATDIHPLPISESDYCQTTLFKPTNIKTASMGAGSATPPSSDDNHIHLAFSNDEDAIRQLSRLLLGGDSASDLEEDGSVSEEGSPTKKRMRDDQRPPQSTGMEGMFAPYMTETKQEPGITEFEAAGTTPPLASAFMTPSTSEPMASEFMAPFVGNIMDPKQSPMASATPTSPTNPTTPETPTHVMEQDTTTPLSTPVEVHPMILAHFRKILQNSRSALAAAVDMPGQSKSIFLSLVLANPTKLHVDFQTYQVGPPHGPVFSATVELKSKVYGNCIIKAEAMARRKKDAECHAFHKLVCLLK